MSEITPFPEFILIPTFSELIESPVVGVPRPAPLVTIVLPETTKSLQAEAIPIVKLPSAEIVLLIIDSSVPITSNP